MSDAPEIAPVEAGRIEPVANRRFYFAMRRTAASLLWLAVGLSGFCGPAAAQNLGTLAVGSTSAPTVVTVTVALAGTVSTIAVSTQGSSSLDFADAGGGSCTTSTHYSLTATCTVEVIFAPLAPGLRLGAVALLDSSGGALGTAYVYGTGQGSLLRYNPGTQAVLYSGLNDPQAMVVDAASNIYIADTVNARVLKILWDGSSYGTPVTPVPVGSGWNAPSGVAVDGAGNLFVADAGLDEVVELPWTGSAYGPQFALPGTYTFAQDLTIDGNGDLFILAGTTVTELPWTGSGYGSPASIGSGLSNGQYSTDFVDSSGNIYIADCNNGDIVKESWDGSTYAQRVLVTIVGDCLDGVATDPAGDVYIADFSGPTVLMLPSTGNGTYGAVVTLTSGGALLGPEAIYLDGIGNIYIEDFISDLVEKWSVTDLPTLTFATSTDVGSADTLDGPQTISLLNVGNAPLTFAVPGTGENPLLSDGFSLAAGTCPQLTTLSSAETLLSATSCTYAVNFRPTMPGTNAGEMVLMDDYLGIGSSTQSIGLSGTGISQVTKLAFAAAPASPIALGGNAGTAVSVDEEKSNSAIDIYANDLITLTVTGPSSYSLIHTATASAGVAVFDLSSTALNVPGSYTYTASLAGASSAIVLETVNNTSPQTISFAPASPVTFGVAPVTLTATGGASGNAVTFSIVSGGSFGSLTGTNDSVLTIAGAGSVVIAANQTGNGSYSAAPQVTATIVVSKGAQTISFAPASPETFGAPPITLTATGGASGNAVTFSIVSGGSFGSLSGTNNSILTITGSGTIVLAADQAANSNYSAATQATASIVVAKAVQVINFTPSSPVTYGVAPITLTATGGGSGVAVTFSIVSGTSVGTLSGTNNSVLTVISAGTIVIAADQGANSDYSAAIEATANIVVSKAAQVITFSPSSPLTFGVTPVTLTATGGASANAVTFNIISGTSFGVLSGANNSVLTVTGAGTLSIGANQAANSDFLAATQVNATVVVNKASQTISFAPASPITYGVAPIALTATGGGSTSAVIFSIISGGGFGTLSGTDNSVLTVNGAGTMVIAANQATDSNHLAATQVTATVLVNKAAQTISFAPASPITYGVAPITLTSTGGGSSSAVIFSIVSGGGFGTLSGANNSVLTVIGAGTIVIAANQAADSDNSAAVQVTGAVIVSKAVQTISFAPASPITYGAAPITLTATGGASGDAVIFSIVSGSSFASLSGTNNSLLTITGSGTIVLAANQAANSNYLAAPQATSSLILNKAAQTIAFAPSSPLAYGIAPITLAATGGGSGNAVIFSIVSGGTFGALSGTNNSRLTITGAGTIVVAANEAASANYTAATQVASSIVVDTASQTISFNPPSNVTFGDAPISLTATGGASGNAVTFSVLSGGSVGSLSGSNNSELTIAGTGSIVIGVDQAGSSNYSAAPQLTATLFIGKAGQIIIFTPSPQTYGAVPTSLSATGGRSGSPVVFTYVSGPGTLSGTNNGLLTITGAGTIVIGANQPGSANYSAAAQTTASVLISKAPLAVTVRAANSTYGAAFPTFTGSLAGMVSGDGITASYTTAAGPTSAAGGSYSIVATLMDPDSRLGNYVVTNTPAVLNLTRAALAVVANATSIVRGSAFPSFTGSLTGVVAGDGITASYSTTATTTSPAGGNYAITATLSDPGNKLGNYAVTNTPAVFTIARGSLTVVVNPVSSVYGATFSTFTGTITGAIAGDDITASYSTSATPTSPAGGAYTIVAALDDPLGRLGDYGVTNTPAPLIITKAVTATSLQSSLNPVLLSNATTLSATVTSSAGTPSGTIEFLDAASPLGSVALINGTATLIVSSLTVGSHSVTAVYSGDTNFSVATSGAVTQVVVDFTATVVGGGSTGSTSQTVSPGGTATFPLSIVPTSGTSFPAATILTLAGLPRGSTATVSPSTWVQTSSTSWAYPANTPLTNVLLTIQLPVAIARVQRTPFRSNCPPILWGLLLAPFASNMRRRGPRNMKGAFLWLFMLGISCAAAMGLSGCASGDGFFSQGAQTYTINETVSSGSLSHSATVTLTVE